MFWLLIAILAYIFYALVFIIDKYVVSRPLPHPIVYTFYVGVLSLGVWVLAPLSFGFLPPTDMLLAVLAGGAQVLGWICFFTALNKGEVSKISPFVGAFIGIFTFVFSYFLIGERLTQNQLLALIFLLLGSLIIAFKPRVEFYKNFKKNVFIIAFFASLFFSIFWVITKFIYNQNSFIPSTIWIRSGAAFVSLLLLVPKRYRELIFSKFKATKKETSGIIVLGRIFSVFAAFGIYVAVYLGSVTIVNALQGLQYVFILIIALFLYKRIPLLKKEVEKKVVIQKLIAIIFIGLGLALLVIR